MTRYGRYPLTKHINYIETLILLHKVKTIRIIALSVALAAGGFSALSEPIPTEAPRVAEMSAVPTVKVDHGSVVISIPGDEACQVHVFAITGQLVKSIMAQPGVTTIDLPAGYYIVKCDKFSQRVIIR